MLKRKNQKGFTLIELVLVIVIIAILAAIAIPLFVDLRTQAAIASTKGTLGALRSAATMSYAQSASAGTPTFPTFANFSVNTCAGGANSCLQNWPALNQITNSNGWVNLVAWAPGACTVATLRNTASGWGYDQDDGRVFAYVTTGSAEDPCTY